MELSPTLAQQIVERIEALLGVRVSVLDTSGRVLASSAPASDTAAGRHAPPDAGLTLPLEQSGVPLGALIVHGDASETTEAAPLAGMIAELVICRARPPAHAASQQWARDRFLFRLLQGNFTVMPEIVRHEAAALGIDLDTPHIVALIDLPAGDAPASDLLGQAQRALSQHTRAVCGWLGPRWLVALVAIEPSQFERDRQGIAGALQRFLDTCAASGAAGASAAMGRYYADWRLLSRSFEDARFALELGLQLYGSGRVFLPRDLGLASFVCHGDARLKSELAQRLLQPLVDHPELLATLDVFLQANLSPSETVKALGIHRHTLDYRLRKIAELTGLNPRRFDSAAQLQAALLWLRIAEARRG